MCKIISVFFILHPDKYLAAAYRSPYPGAVNH